MIVGLPGLLLALLRALTIIEPPRGYSDNVDQAVARAKAPAMLEVITFLWGRPSFRHIRAWPPRCTRSSGTPAGHSTTRFFIGRIGWTAQEAGYWISMFAAVGGLGTFLGGFAADQLSMVMQDRRWYVWVPGHRHAGYRCRFSSAPICRRVSRSSLLVVRRDDVSGRGVFRAIVHDDAGARRRCACARWRRRCCCSSRR